MSRLPSTQEDPRLHGWYHTIDLGKGLVSLQYADFGATEPQGVFLLPPAGPMATSVVARVSPRPDGPQRADVADERTAPPEMGRLESVASL